MYAGLILFFLLYLCRSLKILERLIIQQKLEPHVQVESRWMDDIPLPNQAT